MIPLWNDHLASGSSVTMLRPSSKVLRPPIVTLCAVICVCSLPSHTVYCMFVHAWFHPGLGDVEANMVAEPSVRCLFLDADNSPTPTVLLTVPTLKHKDEA